MLLVKTRNGVKTSQNGDVKWTIALLHMLTKNLKEAHGLVVEKAKLKRLSTFKGGPQHQNHIKMNVRILGDAMVM
jgi:hypothetical protein